MEQYQTSPYRRPGRYHKKQGGGWSHILLFYVLPFLIFNGILFYCVIAKPRISVAIADTNDYLSTEVTLTVNSWFPTKSVTMTIDGTDVELEKGKKRTYTATIYKNGSIEANAVNFNGMPTSVFEQVNVLDDNPPSFKKTDVLDGVVTLSLGDSQSGINFDSIYAMDSAGQRLEPLTVDRSTNTLSFEMDPAGLHVYAQDKAGNQIQGTFTSHMEGNVEKLEGIEDEVPRESTGAPEGTAVPEDTVGSESTATTESTAASGNPASSESTAAAAPSEQSIIIE